MKTDFKNLVEESKSTLSEEESPEEYKPQKDKRSKIYTSLNFDVLKCTPGACKLFNMDS